MASEWKVIFFKKLLFSWSYHLLYSSNMAVLFFFNRELLHLVRYLPTSPYTARSAVTLLSTVGRSHGRNNSAPNKGDIKASFRTH
jgi:hypothetical protein